MSIYGHIFLATILSGKLSVEKREILSHQKIFHEINFLVTSLVKTLLSGNFCQKKFESISI